MRCGLDALVGDMGVVEVIDVGEADELPGILKNDRAVPPSLNLEMNPSMVVCPDFFLGDWASEEELSLWDGWWSSSGDKFRDFF